MFGFVIFGKRILAQKLILNVDEIDNRHVQAAALKLVFAAPWTFCQH